MKKKVDTSWQPVATWYDELLAQEGTYQSDVVLPNLLRLVQPKGKRGIDIACGQGFFARAFQEAGAARVYGIDLSSELILIAKKQSQNIEYDAAPAHRIAGAESGSFDAATIVLALQNIKELQETIQEAARVLAAGGTLALVLNHPAFRIPKASSWGFDSDASIQYRRIDRYGIPFSAEIDMTPGARGKKITTVSFHRPLQDYVKALAKAGFVVTTMEEWTSHKTSEAGPRKAAEDAARREFPMFLSIVARKDCE